MNRLNWFVMPLGLAAIAAFSTSARACSLFEEPKSLNTQVFRLEYSNAPEARPEVTPEAVPEEMAASPSPEQPAAISAGHPYEVLPLSAKPQQVIFIGSQPNRNFQVVVSDSRRETLAALRVCVLDAFATQTQTGKYIQVGSFAQRSEAEILSQQLVQAGYPAQVIRVPGFSITRRSVDVALDLKRLSGRMMAGIK